MKKQSIFWENNCKFRRIFAVSNIAKVLTDLEGKFLMVNEAIHTLWGYDEEEILALTIKSKTPPNDAQSSLEQIKDHIAVIEVED